MWTCKTPINSCFAFGIHNKGISQKEAKKKKKKKKKLKCLSISDAFKS